jgi:hypothetical protein
MITDGYPRNFRRTNPCLISEVAICSFTRMIEQKDRREEHDLRKAIISPV